MKKFFSLLISVLILLSGFSVFAEQDVTVIIDNKKIEFDVPPTIIEGRTLVPMRKIFEELGAKVNWVESAQAIISTYKSSVIAMEIGKNSMSVTELLTGETKEVALDVPSQLIDSRTLVPVRAISEALGKTVGWDDATWTVTITSENKDTAEEAAEEASQPEQAPAEEKAAEHEVQ